MSWIKRVTTAIKGCWFFFWGHLFAVCYYDKEFLQGRWFQGKLHGLCSQGWRWVAQDGFSKLLFGHNPKARFPVSQHVRVICPENIHFHPDDLNNFHGNGNYYQAIGEIYIGRGTYIAPNVGLITANHDLQDLDRHLPPKPIRLGEGCWIGMNAVVLPGVTLGPGTVVGAGAVVTKSFPEGHCILAGNPAEIKKRRLQNMD